MPHFRRSLKLLILFTGISIFTIMFFSGCTGGSWAPFIGEPSSGTLESPIVPVPVMGGATTYYVSSTGNDSNSGTSTDLPWKTLAKVNATNLTPGNTVSFKRGDIFRGQLRPKSGNTGAWISYNSYGTGNKPILLGSINLADLANWTDAGENNWYATMPLDLDIGAIFDSSHNLLGEKRATLNELTSPGDFFWDDSGNKQLYIRSTGNPAGNWTGIEASQRGHIIDQTNVSFAYFENLHLSQGAAHGFGGANTSHLYIKNCDFSYIGGGYLSGSKPTRYGNAIEFWGNAQYNVVDSCRAWEIYDTAYTNQNHTSVTIQNHIYYINNIALNCGLSSFEFWNRPSRSQMTNIFVDHNTSINPGHGWGVTIDRPDKYSFHIVSFGSDAKTTSMSLTNNIFYSNSNPTYMTHHLFMLYENVNGEFSSYQISNNLWNMPEPMWAIGYSSSPTIYTSHTDFSAGVGSSFASITDTPTFISENYYDVTAGNWILAEGSAGIDQGIPTFRTVDANGTPVTGTPDIGAYERP